MTARKNPRPDGLNAAGNGRGLKKVTRPITKKRGASKDRSVVALETRKKYAGRNLTNIPVAELETLDIDKPLTDKAKLFIRYWAQGDSITAASARAGYGDGASYAYRLVHLPQVKALYAEEKRLYEEASQMTRKKVMDGLLDGIDMCKLVGDGPGVITGWKTVGQMCGYFEPVKKRIDINVSTNPTMKDMERMSDADLLKTIAAGAAAQLAFMETAQHDAEDES